MPTASLNRTEIFYTEVGRGLPCLAMHGGLGLDHTHLHPWLDQLGDVLRLVYYDHRGNGRSARAPRDTMTFEQFSADAESLRRHLGLGKIVLLGHSYGAFIALDYALRYPEHLSHLILISAAPAVDYWEEILRNMKARDATEEMLASFQAGRWADDAALERDFRVVMPLNFAPRNVRYAAPVLEHTIFSASAREVCYELLRDYDVAPRLEQIRVPALIMVGRQDVFTPLSQAQRVHTGIPGSTLTVFEESGHFPYVEEPDAFCAAVRRWLRD